MLMNEAEKHGAKIFFEQRCTGVDLQNQKIQIENADGTASEIKSDLIVGADGAFSAVRLQLQQTGSRNDEQHNPAEAWQDPQSGVKQLGAAESEQDRGQQIRGRSNHQIRKSCDDRAERADEILRRRVRGREMAKGNPRRQIFRRIRNKREEKERAGAEKNESNDLVPGAVFSCASHRPSQ